MAGALGACQASPVLGPHLSRVQAPYCLSETRTGNQKPAHVTNMVPGRLRRVSHTPTRLSECNMCVSACGTCVSAGSPSMSWASRFRTLAARAASPPHAGSLLSGFLFFLRSEVPPSLWVCSFQRCFLSVAHLVFGASAKVTLSERMLSLSKCPSPGTCRYLL